MKKLLIFFILSSFAILLATSFDLQSNGNDPPIEITQTVFKASDHLVLPFRNFVHYAYTGSEVLGPGVLFGNLDNIFEPNFDNYISVLPEPKIKTYPEIGYGIWE